MRGDIIVVKTLVALEAIVNAVTKAGYLRQANAIKYGRDIGGKDVLQFQEETLQKKELEKDTEKPPREEIETVNWRFFPLEA